MPIELPEWLTDLRNCKVIQRIRSDPRSIGNTTLGVDVATAFEVVGGGQADFDKPCYDPVHPDRVLSAKDRVLLYAYYLQKRHLEELAEAFRQIFTNSTPDGEPIIVDLGCGPFTGGLAFAGTVAPDSRFDYIGVDCSATMRQFGEELASAAADLDETPRIDHHWFRSVSDVTWGQPPRWRPVFVIVSYLLASPTLNAVTLVGELIQLLEKLGRGSVTVLYTNSIRIEANRQFNPFSNALRKAGFRRLAGGEGSIEINRFHGQKKKNLKYTLFHREKQENLSLEGD